MILHAQTQEPRHKHRRAAELSQKRCLFADPRKHPMKTPKTLTPRSPFFGGCQGKEWNIHLTMLWKKPLGRGDIASKLHSERKVANLTSCGKRKRAQTPCRGQAYKINSVPSENNGNKTPCRRRGAEPKLPAQAGIVKLHGNK